MAAAGARPRPRRDPRVEPPRQSRHARRPGGHQAEPRLVEKSAPEGHGNEARRLEHARLALAADRRLRPQGRRTARSSAGRRCSRGGLRGRESRGTARHLRRDRAPAPQGPRPRVPRPASLLRRPGVRDRRPAALRPFIQPRAARAAPPVGGPSRLSRGRSRERQLLCSRGLASAVGPPVPSQPLRHAHRPPHRAAPRVLPASHRAPGGRGDQRPQAQDAQEDGRHALAQERHWPLQREVLAPALCGGSPVPRRRRVRSPPGLARSPGEQAQSASPARGSFAGGARAPARRSPERSSTGAGKETGRSGAPSST